MSEPDFVILQIQQFGRYLGYNISTQTITFKLPITAITELAYMRLTNIQNSSELSHEEFISNSEQLFGWCGQWKNKGYCLDKFQGISPNIIRICLSD